MTTISARERVCRRAWLVGLWLDAIAGAADLAQKLSADRQAGELWFAAHNLTVAFAAALFWPLDLVARLLLAH